MRVTRYIQVWITQGHEPQVAGIARTFQNLLPQPLFLSWMRCSLWAGKERNDSSLDLGPRAVTEIEKLGPSSLGHIYREGSIQSPWGLFSMVSLELVLQAREKHLVPPFLLQVQWWHTGGLELATVGMFIPQRSGNTISHALFYSSESLHFKYTPLHGLLKSLLCPVSVSLLQLWSWGWRMEPIAVRAEWKWSTKENGAQWIVTRGAWRMHL